MCNINFIAQFSSVRHCVLGCNAVNFIGLHLVVSHICTQSHKKGNVFLIYSFFVNMTCVEQQLVCKKDHLSCIN